MPLVNILIFIVVNANVVWRTFQVFISFYYIQITNQEKEGEKKAMGIVTNTYLWSLQGESRPRSSAWFTDEDSGPFFFEVKDGGSGTGAEMIPMPLEPEVRHTNTKPQWPVVNIQDSWSMSMARHHDLCHSCGSLWALWPFHEAGQLSVVIDLPMNRWQSRDSDPSRVMSLKIHQDSRRPL